MLRKLVLLVSLVASLVALGVVDARASTVHDAALFAPQGVDPGALVWYLVDLDPGVVTFASTTLRIEHIKTDDACEMIADGQVCIISQPQLLTVYAYVERAETTACGGEHISLHIDDLVVQTPLSPGMCRTLLPTILTTSR